MARTNFENLRVYKLSEELSDLIWIVVLAWSPFAWAQVKRLPEFNWPTADFEFVKNQQLTTDY
jgi:hypothetical protein